MSACRVSSRQSPVVSCTQWRSGCVSGKQSCSRSKSNQPSRVCKTVAAYEPCVEEPKAYTIIPSNTQGTPLLHDIGHHLLDRMTSGTTYLSADHAMYCALRINGAYSVRHGLEAWLQALQVLHSRASRVVLRRHNTVAAKPSSASTASRALCAS